MAVKYKITHKVRSHHTNPYYKCLLLDILNEPWWKHKEKVIIDGKEVKGPNVKVVHTESTIMPTDDWWLEGTALMCKISPTFRKKLFNMVMWGDWDTE